MNHQRKRPTRAKRDPSDLTIPVPLRMPQSVANEVFAVAEAENRTVSSVGVDLLRFGLEVYRQRLQTV